MLSCNDICDKLVEKLIAAGFKIDTDTQDHHDIWKALNECTIEAKPEKGSMQVEFLVAWDDGMWTTVIVKVPFKSAPNETILEWANKELVKQPAYRKSVLFAVYQVPAEEAETSNWPGKEEDDGTKHPPENP